MKVIDGGGPVLTRVKVVLIFRGSGWRNGTPSTIDVQNVFTAVLKSAYMSRLVQYRSIRRAEIVFIKSDTADIGSLGPDPRGFLHDNVWVLSDQDIRSVVRTAIAERPPHDGEDTFYLVAFSHDPIPIFFDLPNRNAGGYHDRFDENGRTITYGVVLNWSANTADNVWNSPMGLPAVLTHELVEACTDPDVSHGFRLDNGEELADLADVRAVQLPSVQRDIGLAAYWSELEGLAVVPVTYSLRVALGKRPTDTVPSLRSAMQGTSVRSAILAGCNP